MAIGDPYATVADLVQRIGKPDDGTYGDVLQAGAKAIELFAERQFNKEVVATSRRFRAVDPIRLPVDDFHTVTGLVVDVDGTILDPAEVDPRPWDGVFKGQSGWPFFDLFRVTGCWSSKALRRRAVVTVTAQWGWDAVPETVKNANLILAHRYYRRKDAWAGVAGFGETGLARLQEQDPDVAMTLELYLQPAIVGV